MDKKLEGYIYTTLKSSDGNHHETKADATCTSQGDSYQIEFTEQQEPNTLCTLKFDKKQLVMERKDLQSTHKLNFLNNSELTGLLTYPFGEFKINGKTNRYHYETKKNGFIINLDYHLNLQGEITQYEVQFRFERKEK